MLLIYRLRKNLTIWHRQKGLQSFHRAVEILDISISISISDRRFANQDVSAQT